MANRSSARRCSNCGANNPPDASQCIICGASLLTSTPKRSPQQSNKGNSSLQSPTANYDFAEGEDDLLVRRISDSPFGLLVALGVLAAVVALGVVLFTSLKPKESDKVAGNGNDIGSTIQPTISNTPAPTLQPTNTRPAPLLLPTTTPLPDTPTSTATQGPCEKTAQAGDTVYGLAQQCGHRHLSIVDVVVAENPSLTCATCLREGQTILIPWPTPTEGPVSQADTNANFSQQSESDTVMVSEESGQSVAEIPVNEFGTPDALATLFVEPTLRPGLQWHTVSSGENIIGIGRQYGADAKVLSDINPEITFSQCDFSAEFGGDECVVILIPGQRMRVPAPIPTPTLSATPSGSETPTPTATPTFNVPSLYSPENDAVFAPNSLVTLRWSASGTLALDERYQATVQNLSTSETYQFQTEDLFFVLPDDLQPTNRKVHLFEWSVSIIKLSGDTIISNRAETAPRRFTWQGRS